MKKFSVFSGSRSEYGLLKSLIKKLNNSKNIDLDLIVSGSHLMEKFGKIKRSYNSLLDIPFMPVRLFKYSNLLSVEKKNIVKTRFLLLVLANINYLDMLL